MRDNLHQASAQSWAICLLIFAILSYLLHSLYFALAGWWGLEIWLAALLLHSLLAMPIVFVLRPVWWQASSSKDHAIMASLFILSASLLAVFLTSGSRGIQAALTWSWRDLLILLSVPIAEELVFRRGVGDVFKRRLGIFLGGLPICTLLRLGSRPGSEP